ncbi:TetR/AcrR family transcriptional regulator [Cellulomonas sp. SLBN-39]|uniref:TetR/AcrR family transcriptional regulator n=1 Tax=Cellulomonas sp. SLBN-39 TaxID=2768446 RepID=UPI0011670B30|nr:TetR/AcrR family transcriptional regulator [Cellulomonas sp. SLBN-39]TQL01958.1 TetR family transcriptional regulator [Cellulomonas sp. SLBN-39]
MPPSATPIRQQTRAVVRSLLAQTAMRLFAERGYDRTTVEDVAAAAGVSRRTLFNYFRTKEDLALSSLSEQGEAIADRFAERPADEDLWESFGHAFAVLDEIPTTRENRLELLDLLFGHEALRAGFAEKGARWTDLLAPLVAARMPASPTRDFEARAVAATAVSCLQISTEEWLRQRGATAPPVLFDQAVAAVRGRQRGAGA